MSEMGQTLDDIQDARNPQKLGNRIESPDINDVG